MHVTLHSIRFKFIKCFAVLFVLLFTVTGLHAQQEQMSEDWLKKVLTKHDLPFDSYTVHYYCFIMGKKSFAGDIETYKDAIVVSKGKDDYTIYTADSASYDPATTTLKINDCMEERYKNDSELIVPLRSDNHVYITYNFAKNRIITSDGRNDPELKKAIDKVFSEIVLAAEQMDAEKLKTFVSDRDSAGFINNGVYYKYFDALFSDFKKGTGRIKQQKIMVEHKKITVLSQWYVLLTASGNYSATTMTDETFNGKFAWTFVYERAKGGWKIIHCNLVNPR
ncbi:MAG TPA: nuclear transport factor 2 family protein [Bacteroidales bacterium]